MKMKFFKKNLISRVFFRNLFRIFLLTSYFPLLTLFTTAFANEVPSELGALPSDVSQAVVVEAVPGSVTAVVSGWERKDTGWTQVITPAAAVIGKNGLAPEGEKREGDGRTPSGIFELRRAFGYDEKVATGLMYQRVSEWDFWIDDATSELYNQWVVEETPPAVSHEVLRRQDDLYKYAIVIEYNTDPIVPGMGSAIFLHVWRGAGEPTAGCVAVAEPDILRFLQWLDARQNPVIVLQ